MNGRSVALTIANTSDCSGRCVCMEHTFDPWGAAHRLGLTVIRTKLRHARGYTDGCRRIWVDSRLPTCEARVVLTHELVHVTQGHCEGQPPEVEELVRKITARWLIPWHALMGELGEQVPIEWVAEDLCVTPDVVLDRLTYATEAELAMLREASCEQLSA
jgi:hypothetical protein